MPAFAGMAISALDSSSRIAPPTRPAIDVEMAPRCSGHEAKEPIVQLFLVIKDALADLVRGPHAGRVVGVVTVAAGEHLVAIARGIEEIDGLSARDAMSRRPDVKRDVVAGDDVCGMADIVP